MFCCSTLIRLHLKDYGTLYMFYLLDDLLTVYRHADNGADEQRRSTNYRLRTAGQLRYGRVQRITGSRPLHTCTYINAYIRLAVSNTWRFTVVKLCLTGFGFLVVTAKCLGSH